MTKIFLIHHFDGGITLVEQNEKERIFTPMESLSQMRNYLETISTNVPECNIITETAASPWQKQLAERSVV